MKSIQYITNSCSNEYRFGFNGQEKDQEIYNNQSTTTATFWEYDGRIGRRWNTDPKPTIGISDYACFANSPIMCGDHLGDSTRYYNKGNLIGITHDKLPNAVVDFSMDDKTIDTWKAKLEKNKDNDELNKQLRSLGQVYELKQFDDYIGKADKDKSKEYKGYSNEHLSFLYQIGNRILLGKENFTGDSDDVTGSPDGYDAVGKIHNHTNAGKPNPNTGVGVLQHVPTIGRDDFLVNGSKAYSIVYSPTTIFFYNKANCPMIPVPRYDRFKRKN